MIFKLSCVLRKQQDNSEYFYQTCMSDDKIIIYPFSNAVLHETIATSKRITLQNCVRLTYFSWTEKVRLAGFAGKTTQNAILIRSVLNISYLREI